MLYDRISTLLYNHRIDTTVCTILVAVVSLLKDAGAPPKLTILIVGESLMNDGTAMVLFTMFYNMLQGDNYTISDIVLFFFEVCRDVCGIVYI